MEQKKIFVASLYRFGMDITAAAYTEKKAVSLVMRKYADIYSVILGGDCRADESDRPLCGGRSAYDVSLDSIELHSYTIDQATAI